LAKLTFVDGVKLASEFTVQQMLERDMFDRRLKENKPISLKHLIGLREPWKEDSSGQLSFINFSQEESGWETFP
jgi:hypothetical protein